MRKAEKKQLVERVLPALAKARLDPDWKDWDAIADSCGVSKSSLRTFASTDVLGDKPLLALERWLAAHGYLDAGAQATAQPPVPPAAQADFAANVAAELRALADIVDNGRLSHEARALRYSAAIRSWNAVLQEYEESLRQADGLE